MYDPSDLKRRLDCAVDLAKRQIRSELCDAFQEIYSDQRVPSVFPIDAPKISRLKIAKVEDLNNVYSGAGFYVIFSNYSVQGNACTLKNGDLQAIYRGECVTTKERIKSHLFNEQYNDDFENLKKKYEADPKNTGRRFYKAHWPHCLKLEPNGRSGINVNQPPHNGYQWEVIVHNMLGSSQEIRKIAEEAFDLAFGHPVASRDS